jgi:hypothetical protein
MPSSSQPAGPESGAACADGGAGAAAGDEPPPRTSPAVRCHAQFPSAIGIRDSKNPGGGHLTVSAAAFGDLLADIKGDRLHLA